MKTYALRIPWFTILLLTMIIGYVNATEPDHDNNTSWWKNSKDTIIQLWGDSTQSLEKLFTESPQQGEKDAQFAHTWKQIIPTLEQILTLEQEGEKLPDSAWLSKDKRDNNLEINKLLDEAVAILSVSNTAETRQRIRAFEEKIQTLKQTISQYRQAQVSAPIQSTWETTVADYEAKIKQKSKLIAQYEQAIQQQQTAFAQQLHQLGLYVTPAQLEVLLSSVVGDDIIQNTVVYDNVKQISQQLMTLTMNSGENLTISQRYYGMHMLLLKTLRHMQQQFINQIDEKYLPKITQLMTEVQNITVMTQNLLHGETDDNRRRYLLANLDAQQLTLKTAHLYEQHLIKQRSKIITALETTTTDWKIAQNTYKTVRVSGELINLLRTSQKSFDLLLNLQIPDLLVFENLQMKQEFAILTRKLAQ